MASLEAVLGSIPFYGGYRAATEANQEATRDELKTAGGVLQLREAAVQAEEREALRQAAARSGGDLAKFRGELVRMGRIREVATIDKDLREAAAAQATERYRLAQARALENPRGQSIGAGGLLQPDGSVVPPAARPQTPRDLLPSQRVRERIDGEFIVQEELQPDGSWRELGRGPRFARQVAGAGPSVTVNPPVTPVTLQDPNDPNGTIIVDGRTRQVIGKGPKLTERGKMDEKRSFGMAGLGATIQEAEDLLKGVTRGPDGQISGTAAQPTGSIVGSGVDLLGSVVGYAPPSAVQAERLAAVGGALVSKMPRMEGPQSDADRRQYEQMAARVGNARVPIASRLAALEEVKRLWAKYETPGGGAAPRPAAPGGLPSLDAIEAELRRRGGR